MESAGFKERIRPYRREKWRIILRSCCKGKQGTSSQLLAKYKPECCSQELVQAKNKAIGPECNDGMILGSAKLEFWKNKVHEEAHTAKLYLIARPTKDKPIQE